MPESRSLSELTRQIAPPTKNGHAPPPTESRKSYRSVNPFRVRAGIIETSTIQQERLQAIAEKRKRQTEIENKRRQLEDDRRQLQHLKSKALRERWLLEGAPSSTAEEGEATKKLMEEDNLKAKELEENIQRLEKELEQLENGISASSTKENMAEETTRVVVKEEKLPHTPKTPLGSAKADNKASNSPIKVVEGKGSGLMKAAMYSVEITVEKDKLTGETKVLSSTTRLPKENSVQGVKVYEDELKVVHAVRSEDGAVENGVHQLSSSEVDELIHKADEVTLSEVSEKAAKEAQSNLPSQKVTPRKEITGVQAKPMESPKLGGEGPEPSKEQPVTMIFMGYQNVEDENETKKVLGLEGEQIKAELVVIEDAENKPAGDYTADHAPPNGSAMEPQEEENQVGAQPSANDTDPKEADQDLDMKKQRCKCCSVM
ncbi:paralemmin-1 [Protobothrops mucrosquamatus]|uniref:paralemmin-1 n=1 Tax=Protobothrops mucrosquamatus TaxID=103944 RepID=UPI000775C5B0|nr:paralemmin-1 [Protobothrops mucrosquamatus]